MTPKDIEAEFKKKVCDELRVTSEGLDRFRVSTPFVFEDGDHLVIVLKQVGKTWALSDEGHTFMRLTYDLDERDLRGGTRQKIISNVLAEFSVQDRDGELTLPIPEGRYGDALYAFVQAILKISDVAFLSRERVRSTFLEDFKAFLIDVVPEEHRQFSWHHPELDPDAKYEVDCRVNGRERPLFIFALPSDDRVRDATISLHQFERWSLRFRSVGIFEDQEEVNRKVLARFSDVCEKQFSSLSARDRIVRYLREES